MRHTNVDEGASMSILSLSAWKASISPQLMLGTHNLLAFNRTINEPLGLLPKLPTTLEGKNVCIDLMVVQVPLDFSFLLRRDYVYTLKVVMSILFPVMSFPHNGNIVMIDKLSLLILDLTTFQPSSLNFPYLQVVSTPPWVHYVETSPMFLDTDASEPLTIFLTYFDSD